MVTVFSSYGSRPGLRYLVEVLGDEEVGDAVHDDVVNVERGEDEGGKG